MSGPGVGTVRKDNTDQMGLAHVEPRVELGSNDDFRKDRPLDMKPAETSQKWAHTLNIQINFVTNNPNLTYISIVWEYRITTYHITYTY
jgi:hypothetical protein